MSKKAAKVTLITIGEAAEILGVSQVTLRRWDASGHLRARRHPVNGFRLYNRTEVERLRKKIESGVAA